MVTLGPSVLYPLLIVIVLASLSLLLLLLILRFKYAKAGLSSSPPKVHIWHILLPLGFGLILISSVTAHHTIAIPLVVTIVLATISLLIFLLFSRASHGKLRTLVSSPKSNVRYVLLLVAFSSILIYSVLSDIIIVLYLGVITAAVSVSMLVLLLTLRATKATSGTLPSLVKSKFRYVFLALVLGSFLSFIVSQGILKVIASKNISSVVRALEESNELRVWNSFPQFSGETGWGEENINVTDKETIQQVSNLLRRTTFELDYVPGAVATRNAIGFWIFRQGTVIDKFSVISATLFVRSGPYGYRPSDMHLLSNLRKTVGGQSK